MSATPACLGGCQNTGVGGGESPELALFRPTNMQLIISTFGQNWSATCGFCGSIQFD